MMPMGLRWQAALHLTCRIAASCRIDRCIYLSDYHEAAIFHIVERLERTAGKRGRPFWRELRTTVGFMIVGHRDRISGI
jgi:hypothetical protein